MSDYSRGIKYDKYANSLCLGKLVIQIHPEWKHKIGKIVYDPKKDENQFEQNSDSNSWWDKCKKCKNFEGMIFVWLKEILVQ